MNRNLQLPPFANEPFTDFRTEQSRLNMQTALNRVKGRLGRHYPIQIGSEAIHTVSVITSINPGDVDQVIGIVAKADIAIAGKAVESALASFDGWKRTPAAERASYLLKAAELMRENKEEWSAWIVLEAGKNWQEADADTAEAIDFLEYYAREMLRLDESSIRQPLVPVPGERNRLHYIPLGVGIIIPPWNFPLAICAGMTAAAIVTGNTVVLKPASSTPVIAHRFFELMRETGLPDGVINYVPGSGADIGDYLVSHPRTRFVCFTGSKEVGLRINRLASETAADQIWIKRVIAEMGGKDGIVVDETADLDKAASAIVASAFGYQGQKCSAGSRAIIVDDVYDAVVSKVIELTRRLTVGLPEHNQPVGPVIDRISYHRILDYIEIGRTEGKLVQGGGPAKGNGYYIEPAIFTDVDPKASLMQEEIFGPVLAIARAADWKEGIAIYNDTEFGLTGSFFSTEEIRIRSAFDDMYCGNLYINRKCTGALVGAHPFGGFNMSGTDSKAGGPDYLLLFTQAKLTSQVI